MSHIKIKILAFNYITKVLIYLCIKQLIKSYKGNHVIKNFVLLLQKLKQTHNFSIIKKSFYWKQ